MYSKELESVIDAALADGVLTDKERAVLHKRAAEEGIDPDELDVVIEGRLAKMKREEDWLRPSPPPGSDKYGNVQKCPNCGAVVEAGAIKCSECGYEFRNLEANSSSQRLAEKLEQITKEYDSIIQQAENNKSGFFDTKAATAYGNKNNAIVSTIKSFPVPTTREDLIEFITSMRARWRNASESEDNAGIKDAYHAKYVECMSKAKVLFPNDPQFQVLFAQEEKDNTLLGKFNAMTPITRFMMILMGLVALVALIFKILGVE